ncbi:hypothetical protein Pelo_11660 [Pelomyxa schiedti]|nr:hypothetical protein Pelo_11660 [Pelomyxa schiedti]
MLQHLKPLSSEWKKEDTGPSLLMEQLLATAKLADRKVDTTKQEPSEEVKTPSFTESLMAVKGTRSSLSSTKIEIPYHFHAAAELLPAAGKKKGLRYLGQPFVPRETSASRTAEEKANNSGLDNPEDSGTTFTPTAKPTTEAIMKFTFDANWQ